MDVSKLLEESKILILLGMRSVCNYVGKYPYIFFIDAHKAWRSEKLDAWVALNHFSKEKGEKE